MIPELIRTGHLPALDWLWLALLFLVVLIGIGAIAVIWRTRPTR